MKVLLDPGHPSYIGNKGAVKGKFVEREWTLNTARLIWSKLHREGVRCDLTRHDVTTPVSLSARQSQSEGYDLYVSLHTDKSRDPRVSGMVCYVRPDDNIGARHAKAILDAYSHPGRYVKNDRVYQRSHRPFHSDRFRRVHNCIKKVKCPALLVEAGFVSNPKDLRRLKFKRNEIVDAIVQGILS